MKYRIQTPQPPRPVETKTDVIQQLVDKADGPAPAQRIRHGSVAYVPPPDPVRESGLLRIELIDDHGESTGFVNLPADAFTEESQRRAIEIFAFNVEEGVP